MLPSNALSRPISELIAKLEALPVGTTFQEVEGELYGGQQGDLGTAYQIRIDICEGLRQ